jgi:hypothetical protein
MKKLPLYISLLLLLTCAKEDSQAPNTPPTQIVKQYTLTASAGDGGTVSGGGTFAGGTQVSITATPNAGYSFSSWSNGSTANPLTVTLNSNTSITANFQVIVNSYTLTVSAGEGGSVSTEGGEYEEGTEVTITAIPDDGYRFISWSDGNTTSERNIQISENISISADFVEIISLTRSTIIGPPDQVVLGFALMGIYQHNNDNIFFHPSNQFDLPIYPLIHLKRNENWELEKIYTEYYDMQLWRDFAKIDNNNFVVVDTGLEFGQEIRNQSVDLDILDMGEVYLFNFENNQLTRTTLSPHRGYYHSVDTGDINGDNKNDIISLYMALPAEYRDSTNGTELLMFSEDQVNSNSYENKTDEIKKLDYLSNGSGAVIVGEFTGDSQLDIIKFRYSDSPGYDYTEDMRFSYVLLSYNNQSNQVELVLRKERFDEIPTNYGIAWARSSDIDYDGDNDLIVFLENDGPFIIQSWKNDSTGNFSFHQQIIETERFQPEGKILNSRDFEVYDFDQDGDLDIFLNPQGQIPYPINFSDYIFVNNNGTFEKYSNDLIWDQDPNSENEVVPIFHLRFMEINEKPAFFGFKNFDETTGQYVEDGRLEIYEFIIDID